MQRGLKRNLKSDKAYFITMTVVGWIDVFTRKNHRDEIINARETERETERETVRRGGESGFSYLGFLSSYIAFLTIHQL